MFVDFFLRILKSRPHLLNVVIKYMLKFLEKSFVAEKYVYLESICMTSYLHSFVEKYFLCFKVLLFVGGKLKFYMYKRLHIVK